MRKLFRLGSIYAALSIILAMSTGGVALAATTNSGTANGFKISPVRTDYSVNPGSTKTVQVFITNVTQNTENLQVLVNDFTTNNENGAPSLYLNNQSAPSHSLRQFVTLSSKTLDLQPGEQKIITVVIAIPAGAKPGGYFGAVRVAPASLQGQQSVNLAASVASLILVTVPGDYAEQMSLASFDVLQNGHQHSIFKSSKGLQVRARFNNTGDVQEQPFGKVNVLKGGKIVYSAEINNNDPRGNVLPNSIRKFTVDIKNVSGFGKYTVEGNFGYGGKGQLLSAKTTFYVVPLMAIVWVLIVVVVVLFLVFGLPRLMRGHDQRVLRRAGRR
jgi:hypothetical protein